MRTVRCYNPDTEMRVLPDNQLCERRQARRQVFHVRLRKLPRYARLLLCAPRYDDFTLRLIVPCANQMRDRQRRASGRLGVAAPNTPNANSHVVRQRTTDELPLIISQGDVVASQPALRDW